MNQRVKEFNHNASPEDRLSRQQVRPHHIPVQRVKSTAGKHLRTDHSRGNTSHENVYDNQKEGTRFAATQLKVGPKVVLKNEIGSTSAFEKVMST